MPPAVVTVTSTVPAVPVGTAAVIEVPFELTEKFDTDTEPNFTPVARVRFVPLMVTKVPPASGPMFELTPVTDGCAR